MKPHTGYARHSSDLSNILHAIPSAVMLAAVALAALTLLTLRPLEMICSAVIVWRLRGGA